jgi:hypothetical protein
MVEQQLFNILIGKADLAKQVFVGPAFSPVLRSLDTILDVSAGSCRPIVYSANLRRPGSSLSLSELLMSQSRSVSKVSLWIRLLTPL